MPYEQWLKQRRQIILYANAGVLL